MNDVSFKANKDEKAEKQEIMMYDKMCLILNGDF